MTLLDVVFVFYTLLAVYGFYRVAFDDRDISRFWCVMTGIVLFSWVDFAILFWDTYGYLFLGFLVTGLDPS